MIPGVRRAALMCALLAFATPSPAQDALNKRVSLDLKAMAPSEAFKVIATAIGYTVDVAPEVSTPVDIVVRNITARTALNTICESIGCAWRVTGTVIGVTNADLVASGSAIRRRADAREERARARTVRVTELRLQMDKPLPPDMKFENAPLAQVAERLSKATGFEITFSGDAVAGQTFSADLSNRPLSAALRAIVQQLKGDLICRVGMMPPKDSTGNEKPRLIFEIGPRRK